MRITILGSGTSQGVPMIGCDCEVCRSKDPKDHRTRCSIWVEDGENSLLVDSTPDLRFQALKGGISKIDAVVFTHSHADHIMGFDDLRRFCDILGGKLPIYADVYTMDRLKKVFDYVFDPKNTVHGYLHPEEHLITGPLKFGEMEWIPLKLPHGSLTTLGFLFKKEGNMRAAYLTDCKEVPEEVIEFIQGVPVVIIDGLRDRVHPSHMNIEEAIAAIRRIGPKQAYITHLTHEKSHEQRLRELPKGIEPAYDGLRLEV